MGKRAESPLYPSPMATPWDRMYPPIMKGLKARHKTIEYAAHSGRKPEWRFF